MANEMVSLETHGERIERPSHRPHRSYWAADMLKQDEPATGAQNAPRL